MTEKIAVVVVDPSLLFAQAAAAHLLVEPDLDVVAAVTTTSDVLRLLPGRSLDVLVMDADLATDRVAAGAGGAGLERQLWERSPHTAVVALSDRPDAAEGHQMLALGCLGWVPKDHHADDLLTAVRSAAAGRAYLPADLLAPVIRNFLSGGGQPVAGPLSALTRRESEILGHLSRGRNRAEVADRLGLSPNTVRTHVQSILHKLGVHSTLAAVAVARRAWPVQTRERWPA